MNAHDQQSKPAPRQLSHGRIVRRLVLVAVCMFGFGFAMWPLYSVFCDLTGFGGRAVQIAESNEGLQKSDRQVRVRFDATVNSGLPWEFQPQQKTENVVLGELTEALYLAMNPSEEAITGRAIYNITPPEASLYFVKTECFCFSEQVLQANETREMPVYFFIQPDLPEHIREITLSYTFFREKNASTAALAANGSNEE
jgi:cytochrome c oxidase assembly protein subunit 11